MTISIIEVFSVAITDTGLTISKKDRSLEERPFDKWRYPISRGDPMIRTGPEVAH